MSQKIPQTQKQNRDISPTAQYDNVDISVASLPQYDNANAWQSISLSIIARCAK